MNGNYERAAARVATSAALQEYEDILLHYQWDNWDEHLQWVAEAEEQEILDWCKTIRAGEEN